MNGRLIVFLGAGLLACGPLYADYTQELRDQMQALEDRHEGEKDADYFHDMGIIARKADEAGLNDLALEITEGRLFKPMEEFLKSGLESINHEYENANPDASRHLEALSHYERFYEPTQEFLGTSQGQILAAELVRLRQSGLDGLKKGCSDIAIKTALEGIRKTGLFITKTGAEITDMRELTNGLECCLGWQPKIHLKTEHAFETDYEQGTVTEETELLLQTNRRDLSQARWEGEWTTRFKGREGTGEGLTHAKLIYHKGNTTARLAMPPSKLSSVGRFNFPLNLSGSDRTFEIQGQWINPSFAVADQVISMTGCREQKG